MGEQIRSLSGSPNREDQEIFRAHFIAITISELSFICDRTAPWETEKTDKKRRSTIP